MRADLTTQAADFVRTLRSAQELEKKDQVGSSLAWYLKAQETLSRRASLRARASSGWRSRSSPRVELEASRGSAIDELRRFHAYARVAAPAIFYLLCIPRPRTAYVSAT